MGAQKRKLPTTCKSVSKRSRKITCQDIYDSGTLDQTTLEDESFYLTNNAKFFPDLVWELVASKFKTRDDIEKFSNTGYYFKMLVENKRETEIVIPKIFEILAEKYATSDSKYYKETKRQSLTWNRPKGKRFSRMTGIWKCRLVCKSWNKAIEDLHERHNRAHFVNSIQIHKPISNENYLAIYARYKLSSTTDVFLKDCNPSHYDNANNCVIKNPFLGRSLTMDVLRGKQTESFRVLMCKNANELIQKWGSEIWFCTISDYRFLSNGDLIEFYHSLRNFLLKMPNLKVLNIACGTLGKNASKTNRLQLKREILENPLPQLPNILSVFLKTYGAIFISTLNL